MAPADAVGEHMGDAMGRQVARALVNGDAARAAIVAGMAPADAVGAHMHPALGQQAARHAARSTAAARRRLALCVHGNPALLCDQCNNL